MPAYISEIDVVGRAPGNNDPDSVEFVEIAVDKNTDVSGYAIYVYASDGTVSEGPLSLGTVQGTAGGKDTYLVNGASGLSDITYSEAIALVDDAGNVVQFSSFHSTAIRSQVQRVLQMGRAAPISADMDIAKVYSQMMVVPAIIDKTRRPPAPSPAMPPAH